MATTIHELTYDLSVRGLAQQEASLNELRSRTGVLLAATAIAIALLGGRSLDDGARTALDLAGVALAVGSFLLGVFVLAPKPRYVATPDAAAIHEYLKERNADVAEALEASCTRTARRGRRTRRSSTASFARTAGHASPSSARS